MQDHHLTFGTSWYKARPGASPADHHGQGWLQHLNISLAPPVLIIGLKRDITPSTLPGRGLLARAPTWDERGVGSRYA